MIVEVQGIAITLLVFGPGFPASSLYLSASSLPCILTLLFLANDIRVYVEPKSHLLTVDEASQRESVCDCGDCLMNTRTHL